MGQQPGVNYGPKDLANGMLVADQALHQGVNKVAIKKAFEARGLTM